MGIKSPQTEVPSRSFAGAALDGLAGVLTDSEFFPYSEISGTASLGLAADLWTDGPKVVIPGNSTRIEYTGVYRRPWYQTGAVFTYFTPAVEPVALSDIEGAAALTITGTATLAGVGELATSTPLVFGGTSALTGTGELAGASALTFGDSATLIALDGSISGSGALAFAGTFTLAGSGALTGAAANTFGGTSALTGTGALAGSGALLFGQNATLIAVDGRVVGSSALAFDASGLLVSLTPADATDEVITGGYLAEYRRQRRRKRRGEDNDSKTPAPLPSAAQAGPGSADATPPAPAADLELIRQLVAYWTGEADRELLNRRAQRALEYALRAQTVLAMQLFERELARQMEDEEMSALLILLADD